MRVSIGVPAYNQGQYLAETLDSLLRQTEPPVEIVVSDNHSTDETGEVLRRYDTRVRIIRPPEHLPVAAHFNYLVEHLTGDWFSLLSSDDVAEPNFVRHLSAAVTCDRNAVLVRGGWLTISPTGQRTGSCLLWSTSTVTEPPRTFTEQLSVPKVSFAAFLCRRSAWAQVGGFPPSLRGYPDWGLWLRLSAVGTFVTTHRVVSRYRTYPTNRHLGRVLDFAHDEREIALHVALGVAEQLGPTIPPLLHSAAARTLTRFLAQVSELATDQEVRLRIAAELRPLALATGQEQTLAAFIAGDPVTRSDRLLKLASGGSVIKAQLRTVTRRLRRLRGAD